MTLKATPDMRAQLSELIRQGRVTRSAVEYAHAQGYQDADIIAVVKSMRHEKAAATEPVEAFEGAATAVGAMHESGYGHGV